MKHIFFLLFFALFILSCGKEAETEKKAGPDQHAFVLAKQEFYKNLLEPSAVAAKLQASEAPFNPKLLNDPTHYSLYAGEKIKAAANMGIYLSDLNYSVAYAQPSAISSYFEAANGLSKVIGIQEETLKFLMKRYQANIANNDSVKNVMADLLTASTQGLQADDKEKLAGVAMGAYQIENLHLALGILSSYPKNSTDSTTLSSLFKIVLEQKKPIQTTYQFLQSISDPLDPHKNPNYPYYVQSFQELIGLYEKWKASENMGSAQLKDLMSNNTISELTEKVNAIRSKIVSTE